MFQLGTCGEYRVIHEDDRKFVVEFYKKKQQHPLTKPISEKRFKPKRKRITSFAKDDEDEDDHKHIDEDKVDEDEDNDSETLPFERYFKKYDSHFSDHLAWQNVRSTCDSQYYVLYDTNGIELIAKELTKKCWSEKVAFIALPQIGTVVSPHHPSFVVVMYEKTNGEIGYAPGHAEEFRYQAKTDTIEVRLCWLKTDAEFLDDPDLDEPDASLENPVHHWMPISCIKGQLSHIGRKVKELSMPEYILVLNRWERDNIPYNLHSCSRLLNNDRLPQADIFDYLQFYYIPDQFIWRTCLGAHILIKYVNPISTFGIKPRHDLILKMMLSQEDIAKVGTRDTERTCDACAKHDIVLYAYTDLFFGCVCAARLQFIRELAMTIRAFRGKRFSFRNCECLLPQLNRLHIEHFDQANERERSFTVHK